MLKGDERIVNDEVDGKDDFIEIAFKIVDTVLKMQEDRLQKRLEEEYRRRRGY